MAACIVVTSQQQHVFVECDCCLTHSADDLLINIAEN